MRGGRPAPRPGERGTPGGAGGGGVTEEELRSEELGPCEGTGS